MKRALRSEEGLVGLHETERVSMRALAEVGACRWMRHTRSTNVELHETERVPMRALAEVGACMCRGIVTKEGGM